MKKRRIRSLVLLLCIMAVVLSCKKKAQEEKKKISAYDYMVDLSAKFMTSSDCIYNIVKIEDAVEVIDYKNMDYEVPYNAPTDEEVNEVIAHTMKQFTYREASADAVKVEEGDMLLIDFIAKKDGEIDENASLRDYEYTLGTGIRSELAEKLVGLTVGNTYDIPAKLSSEFPVEGYRDAELNYEMTIKEKVRYITPELNDEYAVKLGATDASAYVQSVKDSMASERSENYKNAKMNALYDRLINSVVLKDYIKDDYEAAATIMRDMVKLEDSELSDEEVEVLANMNAERYMKEKLMVMYVAAKEGIGVSEEEFEEAMLEYVNKYRMSQSAFLESLGDSEPGFVMERCYEIIQKKIKNYLFDTYWNTSTTGV